MTILETINSKAIFFYFIALLITGFSDANLKASCLDEVSAELVFDKKDGANVELPFTFFGHITIKPGVTVTVPQDKSICISGNINIYPSSKLIIKGEVSMCPYMRVIVQRGAVLKVDGGTIRSEAIEDYNDLFADQIYIPFGWAGVEVWGNPNSPHPETASDVYNDIYPSMDIFSADEEQGVVILTNNAKIINAYRGVTAKRRMYNNNNPENIFWEADPDFYGGIILADNTLFYDNNISIEMVGYTKKHNINYVKDCTFEYLDQSMTVLPGNLRVPVFPFQNHIYLESARGIQIANNTFNTEMDNNMAVELGFLYDGDDENEAPPPFKYVSAGSKAIEAQDSDFDIYNNHFEMCPEGIFSGGTGAFNLDISITDNSFNASVEGINLIGVDNSEILNNDMKLAPFPFSLLLANGIFMSASNSYLIEGNNIDNSVGVSDCIRVYKSGEAACEIYRNKFSGFGAGVSAYADNSGLVMRCNDMTGQVMPFAIIGSINPVQGSCDVDLGGPAGNLFSHFCIAPEDDYFIDISGEGFSDPDFELLYAHEFGDVFTPKCYSSNITLKTCAGMEAKCPDNTVSGTTTDYFFSLKEKLTEVKEDISQTSTGAPDYFSLLASKERLKSEIGVFYNRFTRYALKENALDSVLVFLEDEEEKYFQKKLIELYTGSGRFDEASDKLNGLVKNNFEDSLFVDYHHTLISIFSEGRNFKTMNMTEDSTIRAIADTNAMVSIKAQNALYPELIENYEFRAMPDRATAKTYFGETYKKEVLLYPNPVRDYLILALTDREKTNKNMNVLIYDLTGSLVYEKVVQDNENTLQLNFLKEGAYIIQVLNDNREVLVLEKFVKLN